MNSLMGAMELLAQLMQLEVRVSFQFLRQILRLLLSVLLLLKITTKKIIVFISIKNSIEIGSRLLLTRAITRIL